MEVEHIPHGFASFCQPVDVGIKISLQSNIHKDWEVWVIDLGIIASTTKPQTARKLIVEWMMKAYNNISVEVNFNSLNLLNMPVTFLCLTILIEIMIFLF